MGSRNVNESQFIALAPTVTATAYASGECIGGKLTLTNALPAESRSGFLTGVSITSLSAINAQMSLILFDSDPTATTITDKAAFTCAAADMPRVIGAVDIPTTARYTLGGNNVVFDVDVQKAVRANTTTLSGTLFGVLIARGAMTFSGVADLTIELKFSGD